MKHAVATLGVVAGALVLAPLGHLLVWSLIPPLSPRALARRGGFVSVAGVETYYERHGSGPPILLIPAAGAHTSTWRRNIPALSRSHEVWTFDLPGSGYTAKPAGFEYTHEGFARFVRDFMDVMRIPKAVICGHSLGGAVALAFGLDHPGRASGLILIDSGGYPREGPKLGVLNPLRYPLVNAALMAFSSYPPVVRAFYSHLYHDPRRVSGDTALIQEICAIHRTPNARAAYYWLQRDLNFDFSLPDPDRIRSISTPTLILWGRQDRIVSVRTAERLHEDVPGSRLTLIEDAGHMPHEEQAEAVNRVIESFLASIRW